MEGVARLGVASTGARRSPGLAALFGRLREDGGHSILDLGPASGAQLEVLSRFASQVRFAAVLPGEVGDFEGALRALPPNRARPYDVVLAWDVLDRLPPPARAHVVARLAEVTAPGAGLLAIANAEGGARPSRFTVLARDRVTESFGAATRAAQPAILPAEMQRLLEPFQVVHAFVLRTGAREYVAVKT